MMDSRDTQTDAPHKGLIGRTLSIVGYTLGILLMSLFISIVTEWLGMTYFWKEQGLEHGAELLQREVGYLDEHFQRGFYSGRSTVDMAITVVNKTHDVLYIDSGLKALTYPLSQPVTSTETSAISLLKTAYKATEAYLFSAIISVQLFSVRLLVVGLSIPAYLLIGYAALFDGLVKRELRKYGGGIERAFVYHKAKSMLRAPILLLPALLYLSLPFHLEPQWVFLPSMLLFAITVFITATTFKKYL